MSLHIYPTSLIVLIANITHREHACLGVSELRAVVKWNLQRGLRLVNKERAAKAGYVLNVGDQTKVKAI